MNLNEATALPVGKFPRRLVVKKKSSDLIEAVVDVLEERLRMRLSECKPKPLGLATGRTMRPLYKELVARLQSWPVPRLEKLLDNWCSFNLDEYVGLSASDSESFITYMTQYIGHPLKLSPDKLRVPNGRSGDPQREASSYREELRICGGVSIQILGLGVNGHLGFNEPPCGPDTSCRVVNLSPSTREQNAFAFHGNPDLVPSHAITLGLEEILSADEIHLIVSGESKAEIVSSLLAQPASDSLPASWLKQHPNVFLWADYSALGKVNRDWLSFNNISGQLS